MNYVSDILSHLRNSLSDSHNVKKDKVLNIFFNEIYVYLITLIEMSDIFKLWLLTDYTSDKQWDKVLKTLQTDN